MSALGTIAGEACASLVRHYSDPVHVDPCLPTSSSNDNDDVAQQSNGGSSQINDETAPYFDPALGWPLPDLSPVCAFWHRRLLAVCDRAGSSSVDGNAPLALDAAQELLRCYKSAIHPCLRRGISSIARIGGEDKAPGRDIPSSAVVEIVRNYELFVAHFMMNAPTKSASGVCNVEKHHVGLTDEERKKVFNNEKVGKASISKKYDEISINPRLDSAREDTQQTQTAAWRAVHAIADDILQWSARLPTKDEALLWKVRNVLLPCLLRLTDHAVILLALRKEDINKTLLRECLATATVTAASFVGDGKLLSGTFGLGSLLHWIFYSTEEDCYVGTSMPPALSLAHGIRNTLPPLSKITKSTILPASMLSSNFMRRQVVNFSVPSARFDAPWSDGVTGIGSRAAMSVLRTIREHASRGMLTLMDNGEVNSISENGVCSIRQLLRDISQNIGSDVLASTIRTHFFRMSPYSSDANAAVQSQNDGIFMPMVKRLTSNSHKRAAARDITDEKPHIDVPMRLSAAALIFSAVLPQPCNSFEMSNKMFSDAIPVTLALLDDVQSIHQAIGALIFVSVLESASSFDSKISPPFVERYSSIVNSSLESAIRQNSREEPTVLTVICLAQSRWIKYLGFLSVNLDASISPSAVRALTCKATTGILVSIRKQAQTGGRTGNDERIAGALAAGINPLLTQLITFPEAPSVEITRIGLSVLLPLLGWSGTRLEVRSAQVLGIMSLISLMNGSAPVMPNHGKKIMTTLFLLLDRIDKDAAFLSSDKKSNSIDRNLKGISTDVTMTVALYAASVALVICGCSAEHILLHVEKAHSTTRIRKLVKAIRQVCM